MYNLELGNGFLYMIPKAQATKETNKLHFITIKICCAFKGHYQESETTTHITGENICKSHI